jgi:uncharacterized protein (DUF2062 family)
MGLKRFFKRVLPSHHEIREHKQLQLLGDILHDPNIFHLTKHSAAGGVALGLFWACVPIPGQMLVSAICAIYFRVNLPLAVILVWITNPLTIPPYLFLAYKTGTVLLNEPTRALTFEMSFTWFAERIVDIWQPLLLGCMIYGVLTSIIGYGIIRWLWRLAVIKKWEARKMENLLRSKSNT